MSNPTLREFNRLQCHGVVSDNAVSWADVPAVDRARAAVWLEAWRSAAESVCRGCSGLGFRLDPLGAGRVVCPVCEGARCA